MGITILLADGSMAAQNSGKKILTEAGYEVVTVSNGLAAGNKISELHPALALLDVYMPGYSGLEVCAKAKAAPQTAQMPVLLTVGKMEPFRAEEGNAVRADGVLIKPFEAKDLIATVERFVPGDRRPQPAGPVDNVVCKVGEVKLPLDGTTGRSHSTAGELPGPSRSALANNDGHPSSRKPGSQVCDVCGFVNASDALVCQQCDVPLPSSLPSTILRSACQD